MNKKLFFFALLAALLLSACSEQTLKNESDAQNSSSSTVSSADSNTSSSVEASEASRLDALPNGVSAEKTVKTQFTALVIASSHEASLGTVTYSLEVPESLTVDNGEQETAPPYLIKEGEWYMMASNVTTGIGEDLIRQRAEELGSITESIPALAYPVLLVMAPAEKYSLRDPSKKLMDGYDYSYFIMLEEDRFLSLTFFSEKDNDEQAKAEFRQIVQSFTLVE